MAIIGGMYKDVSMIDVAGSPVSNPCSKGALDLGKFYHAFLGDPTKYVQCNIWGKAYIKTCPLGTQWHNDIVNCVNKHDTNIATNMISSQKTASDKSKGKGYVLYDTHYRPVGAPTMFAKPAVSNPCSSGRVRYVAHPQLPYKYFVCVNQRPLLASCAFYHVWVQQKARCVDMSEVTTTETTTTTPQAMTTTRPPTTTKTQATTTTTTMPTTTAPAPSTVTSMDRSVCLPANIRFHPYPGDETRYIECRLWQVISVHACPPSQVWNQLRQSCLSRPPPTTTTTPTTTILVTTSPSQMESTSDQATSTKNFCLGAESHYFPYPPDSARFIQCDAFGNMFLRYCGSAKVWDNTYKTCVGRNIISWPQDKNNSGDGLNSTSGKQTGELTDTKLPIQVTCPQSYVWVIYTACCQLPVGVAVAYPRCQTGFKWSSKLQMCVAVKQPGVMRMKMPPTTPPPTTQAPTTPADENPCGKGKGNYFSIIYDSSLYLQCDDNGHVTVKRCAAGLVWNQQTVSCLRPATETGPRSAPVKLPRLCTPSSPLYQPHPGNNLLLLMCVRGAPYVMQCPYRAISVCNWPPFNVYGNTWIQE